MNCYTCIDDMWMDVLSDLVDANRQVSRAGDTREIIGWCGQLNTINQSLLMHPRRALSVPYAVAELTWYLSGSNSVKMMLPYAPKYGTYVGHNEIAYGAYGDRLTRNTSLYNALEILREHPESRQCVVLIWDNKDLQAVVNGQADIPCTVSIQFLIRNKRLHCVVNMRSNDVWLGMPYDVFCFTSIQRLLAGELGIIPGSYTHVVGSMHLYDKNNKAAHDAINSFSAVERPQSDLWNNNPYDRLDRFYKVISAEKYYSTMNDFPKWTSGEVIGPMISDCIEVFRCFWSKSYPGPKQFNCELIRKSMESWKINTAGSES